MPVPFTRLSGPEREPVSLLVTVLTCGAVITAGTYFAFLYWMTRG